MTAYSEIVDLQNYLKSHIGLNVRIGNIDFSANELPIILIIPDDGSVITLPTQDNFLTMDFGLKIRLIDNKNETGIIKTLQNMDKILSAINNFSGGKNHKLQGEITTEYGENTYSVTIRFILRLRYLGG